MGCISYIVCLDSNTECGSHCCLKRYVGNRIGYHTCLESSQQEAMGLDSNTEGGSHCCLKRYVGNRIGYLTGHTHQKQVWPRKFSERLVMCQELFRHDFKQIQIQTVSRPMYVYY